MSSLGERLKTMRNSRNMTQADLSEALGVSRSAVAMWESDEREPNLETLEAIADTFNVSLASLVENNPAPPTLDEQLSGIDFALSGEIHDLTDDEKRDLLDYVRFKRNQRQR